MKQIALALENFSRFSGGAESYAVELADTLKRNGWHVHLIGHSWDGSPEGVIFHKIPKLSKLFPPFLRILYFALKHRTIVKKLDLNVIVGFGNTIEMNVYQSHGGVHFVSSLRKIRAETSRFVRFVKTVLTFITPKSLARSWIESAPFRKSPMPTVIAISDMVRNDICQRYHLKKDQIHLIYNGVNLRRFAGILEAERRASIRGALGFSQETLFLFMAYDFRKKGVRYLIEAAAKLKEAVGPEKFGVVIVGSRPSPALQRLVQKLNLESTVIFNGPTKEPEKFYKACDVFILPTFYDACSLVVFEAMACGLPVITTVDNGASGILTNGLDGTVLTDPRCIKEMAEAMGRFLDNDFLGEASKAAISTVSRYSVEANHSKMLAIFDSVAGNHSNRRHSSKV